MLIQNKFKIPEIINIEEYKDNKDLYDFNNFVEIRKDKVYLYSKNFNLFFWNLLDISYYFNKKIIYIIMESNQKYLYIYGGNIADNPFSIYNHFYYKIKISSETKKINKKFINKLKKIFELNFSDFNDTKKVVFFTRNKEINYINDFIKYLEEKNVNLEYNSFTNLFFKLLLIPLKEKFLYKISPLLMGIFIFTGSYYYLKNKVDKENFVIQTKSNIEISKVRKLNKNLQNKIKILKNKIIYLEKIKKNNIKIYGE